MPKIPTYNSQARLRAETLRTEKLTEEVPAVRIPEGSFSEPFKALEGLGQTIGKIGENIYALQAQEELSKANIEAHQGRLQIENAEDSETQGWLDRRNKEIQDLKANTLKGMRNPLAKKEFEAEFDNDIIDTQFKLKKAYVGLTVNKVKLALEQEKEVAQQQIFAGINDQRKQARIDKIGKRYSQLARLGGIKPDVALKEFREWQVGLVEGKVEFDILNNPEIVLAGLQKGDFGPYKGITPDKRANFIKQAESRLEKIKNQQEEAIAIAENQKESDLIDLKIAGTLTEQQVKTERQLRTINAKFADSMIQALRRPKKEPKNTTFNTLVDFILNEKNKPEDIRIELLKENAKGEITDDELAILQTFNQNITKDTLEKKLPKKGFLQTISLWSDEYAQKRPEIKAQMFKEYMQKVNTGIDPQDAVNTIIAEKTKQNLVNKTPGMANLPKGKGQLMIDAYGNKAIVYPDGTIEELSKGVKE